MCLLSSTFWSLLSVLLLQAHEYLPPSLYPTPRPRPHKGNRFQPNWKPRTVCGVSSGDTTSERQIAFFYTNEQCKWVVRGKRSPQTGVRDQRRDFQNVIISFTIFHKNFSSSEWKSLSHVQLSLCDPVDYTVHGILQPEYWSG